MTDGPGLVEFVIANTNPTRRSPGPPPSLNWALLITVVGGDGGGVTTLGRSPLPEGG